MDKDKPLLLVSSSDEDCEGIEPNDPIELPIDGVLDLHLFLPREVPDLVKSYLDACLERGLRDVRIVHGKGTGTLRRTVQSILERHPAVLDFRTADATAGGWGVTLVTLRPESPLPPP